MICKVCFKQASLYVPWAVLSHTHQGQGMKDRMPVPRKRYVKTTKDKR